MKNPAYDAIIVGGGAAGLMCAIQAGQRGRRVLLLDHAKAVGQKVLISGGGRCNFTNLKVSSEDYVSENPHFCKSALSRYAPQDFIDLVQSYKIHFHEKKLGQLFCDHSSKNILQMLLAECGKAKVNFQFETRVNRVSRENSIFTLETDRGPFQAPALVVATGGLSFPKLGATDFGYRLAEQFGLKIVAPEAALDGFRMGEDFLRNFADLSGISLDVLLTCQNRSFRENILWTHQGLSGPAALQGSLYWKAGLPIRLKLEPDRDLFDWFLQEKKSGQKKLLKNALEEMFPKRFVESFVRYYFSEAVLATPMNQAKEVLLKQLADRLQNWILEPEGTVGYAKAEVTRGGVSTEELSSKTMGAKKVPGLYFIGEVVDVTGKLGGYNFQWAWSSGWVAGQVV